VREHQDVIKQIHSDNVAAGAEVITTFNYIITPYWLKEKGIDDSELEPLVKHAVKLAREVREEWAAKGRKVRVAGCLPPLAASYDAKEAMPYEESVNTYARIIRCMADDVDLFLMETIPSLTVAKAATEAQLRVAPDMDRWLSFTLQDKLEDPPLMSGETLADAVAMFREGPLKSTVIMFNCAPPEVCTVALDVMATLDWPGQIGVSPNAFAEERHSYGAHDKSHAVRVELTPAVFGQWALEFQKKGAQIIGGCCGAGPDALAAMVDIFRSSSICSSELEVFSAL
jgi:S-methylmethionine-dependent homocysteine/selenocysteine methylase